MSDIAKLALRVVQDGDDDEGTDEWIIDFATRLIAAYLAEQEPRGWWNPSYPSLSVQLTKPHDGGGWEPFFTTPPEPAPQDSLKEPSSPEHTSSTESDSRLACAAPSKMQALDALDCLDDFARMADIDPVGPRKVLEDFINGAAPLPDEVREMVDELREAFPAAAYRHAVIETQALKKSAAHLIERLAGRVPDGCVEQYNELLYAVETKFPGESRHETALRYIKRGEERVVHIAAGEVKP